MGVRTRLAVLRRRGALPRRPHRVPGAGWPLGARGHRGHYTALSRGTWGQRGALGLLLLSRVEPPSLDEWRGPARGTQRWPGRGALAMTQEERIWAVIDCGFTERQARFLVLVMRHGGVCIPRQYASFARIANGSRRCNAFFDRLG